MGIFSRNSSRLGQYNAGNIVADESYYGETGALRITLEGLQNDQAVFDALMEQDFEEAARINEGSINESQIEALQEGAIGDFVNRIKEMVRKIAEKIKGLINSFIARVNSVIIRDNKKFVEKYRREVLSKDLSKMKYKWSDPTGQTINLPAAVDEIESNIDECTRATSVEALAKFEDGLDEGFTDKFLDRMVKGSSGDSFEKDAHELYFKEEDEVEGLDSGRLGAIMGRLINSKDALKDIEKVQKDADKAFSKYLSMIDKKVNEMSKKIPGDSSAGKVDVSADGGSNKNVNYGKGSSSKELAMKQLVMIQKTVTKTQGLFSKAAGAAISQNKFGLAQDRRVFAKAAAYNSKSVKESTFFEAYAEEAAVYDIMSSFEQVGNN